MYKYIQNSKNQRERNNNIEIKKCNKVLKVNCLAAASGAAYRIPRSRLPPSWPFLGPQLQLLLSASLCCCCCGLSSALLQRDRVRGRWLGQWLLHCLLVADCGLRFAGYLVNCVLCVVWRHICMYAPSIARIQSNCLPLEAGTHARTRLTRGTRATPSQARGLYGFRLIALNLVDTQTQPQTQPHTKWHPHS